MPFGGAKSATIIQNQDTELVNIIGKIVLNTIPGK